MTVAKDDQPHGRVERAKESQRLLGLARWQRTALRPPLKLGLRTGQDVKHFDWQAADITLERQRQLEFSGIHIALDGSNRRQEPEFVQDLGRAHIAGMEYFLDARKDLAQRRIEVTVRVCYHANLRDRYLLSSRIMAYRLWPPAVDASPLPSCSAWVIDPSNCFDVSHWGWLERHEAMLNAQPHGQGSMFARSSTRAFTSDGKAARPAPWSNVMLDGTKVGLVRGHPGDGA